MFIDLRGVVILGNRKAVLYAIKEQVELGTKARIAHYAAVIREVRSLQYRLGLLLKALAFERRSKRQRLDAEEIFIALRVRHLTDVAPALGSIARGALDLSLQRGDRRAALGD